jgi:probable rRNA maturation factor
VSVAIAWVAGPRLLRAAEVRAALAAALEHGGRPELALSVVFVSDAELARMHGQWLDDPSPTDVIGFDLGGDEPPDERDGGPQAELYVSAERARAVARARGGDERRELALYLVHGALHLCGYDDRRADARRRMRRAERKVLERLGHAARKRARRVSRK